MTTYCGTRFVVCNSIVFDESAKNELESVSENAEKINQAFLEKRRRAELFPADDRICPGVWGRKL